MFWGITPCLDLLQELKTNGNIPQEINILLVGASDSRHILKTLARRYRMESVKINFYIMESIPEVIAKQILLLNVALQPIQELGLVQKTRIFMELFGNSLVRPITAKYLSSRAHEFIKIITNLDYMQKIMPFLNLELKYKERDYIENVYKFWASADKYDISDCWDKRLRKYLGIRYDTKNGAFDWDLHMRLYHIGGNNICNQEYQSFRNNGVSFSWLESEVSKPNRSMVTGVIPNGDHFGHCGYLGDMQTGPFIAYGVECEDLEYLKKQNNKNKYRSTDITERNLREIFHELEFNEEYMHQKTTEISLGSCVTQVLNLKVVDTGNIAPAKNDSITCFELNNATINFISISMLKMMEHKEKYKRFFNLIYFGNTFLKYLDNDIIESISASNCIVIVEHQKFVVTHRDEDLEKFYNNVKEKMKSLESYECPFDVKRDSYIRFILK